MKGEINREALKDIFWVVLVAGALIILSISFVSGTTMVCGDDTGGQALWTNKTLNESDKELFEDLLETQGLKKECVIYDEYIEEPIGRGCFEVCFEAGRIVNDTGGELSDKARFIIGKLNQNIAKRNDKIDRYFWYSVFVTVVLVGYYIYNFIREKKSKNEGR